MSKSSTAALYICAKVVAIIALALAPVSLVAQENAARPATVLIHPGQTLYIT